MTLYVCIYHKDTGAIEYAEELPFDTPEEKDWGKRYGIDRLVGECMGRGDAAGFVPYASTEKQFTWPIEVAEE